MLISTSLDLCKKFLEMLLNIQIESISLAQPEKTLDVDFFAKGIRLDVFVKDRTDRSFDIEMQVIGKKHLPLRARYYQSVLDVSILRPGETYDSLKGSFVIFLCLEDIFGKGLPIYTFQSICAEDRNLLLGDLTTKVFCNAYFFSIIKSVAVVCFLVEFCKTHIQNLCKTAGGLC